MSPFGGKSVSPAISGVYHPSVSPAISGSYPRPQITIKPNSTGPLYYTPTSASNAGGGRYDTVSQQHLSQISPAGGIVPVVYGVRRIAGKFIYMKVISNVLHAIYILCEGEIESVDGVYLNNLRVGVDIATPGAVTVDSTHLGTSGQTVCTLSTYDATWTDALANIAYLYVQLPWFAGHPIQDLPTVEAVVHGKKVYDPRTGTTIYSVNPALCLADALMNTRYGGRVSSSLIDMTLLSDTADYCEETITTGPTSEDRFTFNYCFADETSLSNALETIRRHFLGVIKVDAGTYNIDVLRPFTAPEITAAPSFSNSEIYNLSVPPLEPSEIVNKVTYQYTDVTRNEQIEDSIEDGSIGANDEIQERSYDLTGCGISQAARIATYLLNLRLSDLRLDFTVYNNKGLQPTDLVKITHDIGLTDKQMYIESIEAQNDGSYKIRAREYDAGFFSDTVQAEPTYPDTTLPQITDVPANVTGLSGTDAYIIADGKERLYADFTWTSSTSIFVDKYEMSVSTASTGVYAVIPELVEADSTVYTLNDLTMGKPYYLKVKSVSKWGVKSTGVTDNVTGGASVPAIIWNSVTVPILAATQQSNSVLVSWDNIGQPFVDAPQVVKHYMLYRSTSLIQEKILSNTLIDVPPVGTYIYALYAVGLFGKVSTAALISPQITVAYPASRRIITGSDAAVLSNSSALTFDSTALTLTAPKIAATGLIMPQQATSAPGYVKGGVYFDTTINKLRIGGATTWETLATT